MDKESYVVVSVYNNVPSILECFNDQQNSQWCEKASRKYQTRNSQNGQNVFFLSSSDRLGQYFVNLPQWFTHETAAFYMEKCTIQSFLTTSKTCHVLATIHSKTIASSLGGHFLYLYVGMHT